MDILLKVKNLIDSENNIINYITYFYNKNQRNINNNLNDLFLINSDFKGILNYLLYEIKI